MWLSCSAFPVATASEISRDIESFSGELQVVDLQAVYNQLLVVNDLLSQILAYTCVIFAFLVFVFVLHFVYNIFFKHI